VEAEMEKWIYLTDGSAVVKVNDRILVDFLEKSGLHRCSYRVYLDVKKRNASKVRTADIVGNLRRKV